MKPLHVSNTRVDIFGTCIQLKEYTKLGLNPDLGWIGDVGTVAIVLTDSIFARD